MIKFICIATMPVMIPIAMVALFNVAVGPALLIGLMLTAVQIFRLSPGR